MRSTLVSIFLLLGAFGAPLPPAFAQDSALPKETERPKTALVLSGGGARGAAHVGVLKILEELRVPVDLIVGTSMGSVVGGFYAAGYTPEQLEANLLGLDWRDLFNDRPGRQRVPFRRKQDDGLPLFDFEFGISAQGMDFPSGLIAGQKFGFVLQTMSLHTAGVEHFDGLPIPFRAVATDLQRGEVVVLERGSLGRAVRASMAVPAMFTPVEVEGKLLIDGGLVRNLPIDVARGLGAERIIAVDISAQLEALGDLSMFSVAAQSLSIFSEDNVREQLDLLEEQDVLIVPELGEMSTTAFDSASLQGAIEVGEHAAREAAGRLRAWAVSEAEYEAYRTRQQAEFGPPVQIAGIRVEGHSRVNARRIEARVKSRIGTALDVVTLRQDLERIYAIGEFQQVAFRLDHETDGTNTLVIEVEEKTWGPNYLRFGLALESNFQGRGDFSALAQLTRTQLNSLGGEWKTRLSVGSEDRLFTEFYQPFDPQGFFFFAPSVEYFERELNALSPEVELEQIRLSTFLTALDVGIQFRNYGELRIGVARGTADVDILTQSDVEPFTTDIGGWRARLAIDRLDNANFPRHGTLWDLELLLSRESLGAEQEYEKLNFLAQGAFRLGKNTILLWADGESNLGSDIPFYERVELGGFLNLSGLDRGALVGNVGGRGGAPF